MSGGALHVTLVLTSEQIDAIATRAAEIVAARQPVGTARQSSNYLTAREAAELLRSRTRRVYELVGDGRLTRHGDGRRLLVSRMEVENLAEGR